MKHTPGPWARNVSTKYPIYAESDHRKIGFALTGNGVSEEEAMANLSLMAAAPDLLKACQAAQLALRATSKSHKDYTYELDLLREAIKKTTE